MSVRFDQQRRTWFFVVDVASLDGKRRQVKRRGFPSKRDAAKAERELLAEHDDGRHHAPVRLTFGDYLRDRWLPHLDADVRLEPTTKASYKAAAQHLIRHAGHVALAELGGEHLDRVQAHLVERSASLRHGVHVVASKSLRQAVRWRLIPRSPIDDATPPPQAVAKPTGWSPNEVARFLDAAADDRWRPLWRLAAVTGARRGELVGLTWSQVDLDHGVVLIDRAVVLADGEVHETTPKSGRYREVAIDAETVAVLRSWRARQAQELLLLGEYRPDTDDVFTWPDGKRVDPSVITRTFRRLAAQAELPPMRLHSLRHAWANAALDAGVELVDVSKRLGHSSIRVTADVYTPKSSSRDRAAVDAVAQLYGGRGHGVVTEHRPTAVDNG